MSFYRNAQWFQAIIFVVCLTLTYASYSLVHRLAQSRSQENFQVLVDQSLASLGRRFDEYSRTLDGVAGLVLASDQVTADKMTIYSNALGLKDKGFIIDAIGLASVDTGKNGLLAAVAPLDDGFRSTAHTDVPPLDRFVVRRIEPRAIQNRLLGLDFTRNADLFSTAMASRDTGRTLWAAYLPDVALQGGHAQAFLLKPIYRNTQNPNAMKPAQEDFLGFAFAVLNFKNTFRSLTPAQDKLVEISVKFEGLGENSAFNGPDEQADGAVGTPGFVVQKTIGKFGTNVSLTWSSTPHFDSIQPFRVRWIVLALGLLVTALINTILRVLIRRERTIAAIVAQKTRDLETQDKEKRSILENAMLAIISVNTEGEILHSNEAALTLLKPLSGRFNLSGTAICELLPGLDLRGSDGWSKLQIASRLGESEAKIIEVEKKRWFTADGVSRITLLIRDITVSERHAQEIAETEQRWNLALMGAKIGVFDLDLKNDTSVVSDTWCETLQLNLPEGCKNPYGQQMDCTHPDDLRLLKKLEAACITGTSDRAVARFRVKVANDEWRWIKSDAVVVERAPDGTALRMLGIQMDVTDSFKLEQMKRDFVATVSHELRTPLTSIKGALGLLQAQLDGTDVKGVDRLIQIASGNSDRLASLVNDILDMEKLNAGNMTHDLGPESLSEVMDLASKQMETYASQWDVEVAMIAPELDHNIYTDKKRIIQVLSNLLSNACKFAHTGTTVRLSAEVLPTHTKISVSNFGPGIPKDFQSKLFQPFSQADNSDTRQRGGTGLGLSISRQLIEAMGGTIGFESEPGQETVFWFTCPLADGSQTVLVA